MIVDAATAVSADSAAKLTIARTIALQGDVSGSATFDGTADVSITVDVKGGNADTIGGYTPNNLMPLGAIVMWSGSIASIPGKWALCNGSNGTPDLRDRFILGAGNNYAVGAVGGEETHKLTIEEMPKHNHIVPGVINGIGGTATSMWGLSGLQPTTDTGGDLPHNNMPPYYALAYIMRVA